MSQQQKSAAVVSASLAAVVSVLFPEQPVMAIAMESAIAVTVIFFIISSPFNTIFPNHLL